ncbi:hypothetical protein JCM3766R1_001875 [Sporobolomyces carnicolor]
MTTLTAAFGLALPLPRPLAITTSGSKHLDITASESDPKSHLALLALPSRCSVSSSEAPIVRVGCGFDGEDASAIVDVSFSGLPVNANHRFKNYIKLFNLEVVDSSTDKISLRSNHREAKKAVRANEAKKARPWANSGELHGVRDRITTRIEPKWRLCLSSKGDW